MVANLSLCLFQFHQCSIAVLWVYKDHRLAVSTGSRLRTNDTNVVRLQIIHGLADVAHLEQFNITHCTISRTNAKLIRYNI